MSPILMLTGFLFASRAAFVAAMISPAVTRTGLSCLLTTTALVPARTHRRASESGMSNGTLAKTTRSIFGALHRLVHRQSVAGKSATEALA
jgi:hypothetical protein